jgi:hypothetical protein
MFWISIPPIVALSAAVAGGLSRWVNRSVSTILDPEI